MFEMISYCFQVYWVGPMCGGVAAALVYDFLLYPKLDDFPDRVRVLVSGPATDYDLNVTNDPRAVEMSAKWYEYLVYDILQDHKTSVNIPVYPTGKAFILIDYMTAWNRTCKTVFVAVQRDIWCFVLNN